MCETRLEPSELPPVKPGRCQWCGARTPRDVRNNRMKYCRGTDCRQKYNNLCAKQGKPLMDMLKLWRKHRGAKGTPGQGVLTEVTTRLDRMIADDRERVSELTAVRVLRQIAEGVNDAKGTAKAELGELTGQTSLVVAVRSIARGIADPRAVAIEALQGAEV